MDNEKNFNPDLESSSEGESAPTESSTAPRARNRTVMLTPEITGQVRARLAQDLGQSSGSTPAPTSRPTENSPSSGDFATPGSGAFYTPGSRSTRPSGAESSPMVPESRGRQIAPPPPVLESREGLVWQKKTPVVGFLVSFDTNQNGDIFELRTGRLIITSESAGQGNYLLVRDESISPMHAILRISQSGEVQVLDQLSEFGTRIRRFNSGEEQELSGDKGVVEHGDIVSFGNRKFHVCMIAMPPVNS